MTSIRMKPTVSLYLWTVLCIVTNSQTVTPVNCTDTLPNVVTIMHCPEDITRIEYQVNIDPLKLTNDGANTVDQIDLFLKWIVDNFQENKYFAEFRLRTTKIQKYYRVVTELKPREEHGSINSLKYRRTFGSFQNTDSYGNSSIKYQNDLTMEVRMLADSIPVFNYSIVSPVAQYSPIFEYKLEPNVHPDTCSPTNWSNYFYGEDSTGYSATISFDNDEDIVADGTDGPIILNSTNWLDASKDDFFCGDCSSNSCICCDIEQQFFTDYCQYFNYSFLLDTLRYSTHVEYIVDVDFYWYKDWYKDPTSEGKLTFLVKYDDLDAKNADIVDSTEFSIKLYKADTEDDEWVNAISFAQGLLDDLMFPSDDIPSNEWFDYSECVPISTEYISMVTNAQEVDEWFIISITFIVLFGVTSLVLCYFVWIYCISDENASHGGYDKAENGEIETATIQETAIQTESD